MSRATRSGRWPASLLLLLLATLPSAVRAEAPRLPAELPAALERIVSRSILERSRAGVLVADLETGEPVFEHHADDLLNPASNMKILTTVAALGVLGPQHRFATEVFFERDLERGILKGDLFLRGEGDPSLTSERLFRIARELQLRGVREVKGGIVVDDTYFDEVWEGPGWEQDDSDSAYMAPAGAVSLDYNAVRWHVRPGDVVGGKGVVEVDPPSAYFRIENHTETAPARARQRVRVRSVPDGGHQKIVVHARLPTGRDGVVVLRRISNPSIYAGETLKALLGELGIQVRGKVRRGITPWKLEPAVVDRSDDLTVLVHRLNKWSQNHMTEQLLKVLGATGKGAPGTWAKGVEVVEEFLARRVGVPAGSFVMRNGSGLNDTNRLSARQLVTVLRWAHGQDLLAPALLSSLPIAGIDGTTRNRMVGTEAEGRLRAKTGTLQNVTALSGFVTSVGGRRYVFSVLVNDFPARLSTVLPAVDAIGAAVASAGSSAGTEAAVASASPPAEDPSTPLDVLRTRLLVYADLARVENPRNAAFLRTALRSERDPAVRAAIAEALWRSDREDASGARALLESFEGTPEVYGRLREATRDVAGPVPALEGVIDLAAEGSADAMGKLLDVAALSAGDEQVEAELAVGLSEIGRTAPEELLASLRGAGDPAREAVVELLARAIVGVDPADAGGVVRPAMAAAPSSGHPFLTALATLATASDVREAGWARELEARLAARMARLESEPLPVAGEPVPPPGPVPASAPGGG